MGGRRLSQLWRVIEFGEVALLGPSLPSPAQTILSSHVRSEKVGGVRTCASTGEIICDSHAFIRMWRNGYMVYQIHECVSQPNK